MVETTRYHNCPINVFDICKKNLSQLKLCFTVLCLKGKIEDNLWIMVAIHLFNFNDNRFDLSNSSRYILNKPRLALGYYTSTYLLKTILL